MSTAVGGHDDTQKQCLTRGGQEGVAIRLRRIRFYCHSIHEFTRICVRDILTMSCASCYSMFKWFLIFWNMPPSEYFRRAFGKKFQKYSCGFDQMLDRFQWNCQIERKVEMCSLLYTILYSP